MNWLLKSAVQNAIGLLPGAERANYVMQKHVTKSLPRDMDRFVGQAVRAVEHWQLAVPRLPEGRRDDPHLYEFGTGWDLIIPLTYWALGAERQTLVDIRANLRWELVNHTLDVFRDRHDALEQQLGAKLRRPEPGPVASLHELRDRFGIAYHAPCDARDTPLAARSVDLVTSTYTFEHIPEREIPPIIAESLRLLRPGGLFSAMVDLQDHFSYIDQRIGIYNFLRYSPRQWSVLDTSLQSLNRLRYPRYMELFREQPMEVIIDEPEHASPADLAEIAAIPLDPLFAGYTPEQLGVRSLRVLGAPRPAPV